MKITGIKIITPHVYSTRNHRFMKRRL